MGELARAVLEMLRRRRWRLVTAESCTGGLIAAQMTDIPGSSDWFEGAFVTYRLSAKRSMLGVSEESLARHTAVSEPVAREMAVGALEHSVADISVAVTGVAGPGGGDALSPVGRVWLGYARRAGADITVVQTSRLELDGDRQTVRRSAVEAALEGLLQMDAREDG